VCGVLIAHAHVAWPLAIVLTILIGSGVGVVNGALVLLGVDSFIATLGMSSILLAFTELLSGDNYVGPLPPAFESLATHSVAGIPLVTIYAFVLAFVVWYVLEHTPIGRRAYATGANPDAARLAGVRTHRHVFVSLVATAAVSAVAGVLVAARIGEVSPTLGPPYLLPVFAACFLGTTQIKVGRFNVWGTVLAIFLLATGVEGLQLAGGALWVTDMFNGVALVGAVSIAVIGAKRRAARGRARVARS
jgi:ribose transport system permease protein